MQTGCINIQHLPVWNPVRPNEPFPSDAFAPCGNEVMFPAPAAWRRSRFSFQPLPDEHDEKSNHPRRPADAGLCRAGPGPVRFQQREAQEPARHAIQRTPAARSRAGKKTPRAGQVPRRFKTHRPGLPPAWRRCLTRLAHPARSVSGSPGIRGSIPRCWTVICLVNGR